MTRDDLREKIRDAAIHFTEEVSAIFAEAFASVAADLKGGAAKPKELPPPAPTPAPAPAPEAPPAPPAPRRVGRPKGSSNKAKPAAAKAAKAAQDRRNRRSSGELDRLGHEVMALLTKTAEPIRVEEINRQLGTNTKDLMRPIQKLIEEGKVKKQGERRATVYFL